MKEVLERMGNGVELSFSSAVDEVQNWGGKVDIIKV